MFVIVARFESASGKEAEVGAVLSKLAVTGRGEPGCYNIDLFGSSMDPGTYLVVEKWETEEARDSHVNEGALAEAAPMLVPLLARRPAIEVFEGISAHDIK